MIIDRNREIDRRSLSRFEFCNAYQRERERDPDDRWTEREERNAFNVARLVKGGNVVVVVGICRWNEEEQRLNEISERGGNKVDGRNERGRKREKKRGEESR